MNLMKLHQKYILNKVNKIILIIFNDNKKYNCFIIVF